MWPSLAGRPGLLQCGQIQGGMPRVTLFQDVTQSTADSLSGGVYYLNKQDDQKDQQNRITVIRTSACFRACATDCSCFVLLSELEGGR